jgi:peroxiredoxin
MKSLVLLPALALLAVKVAAMDLAPTAEAVRPLSAGAKAPVAILDSLDGSRLDLAEVFAAKPTILVFYRGGWCPFCNRHLASLADAELAFRRLGYQIVAISPDPVPDLSTTATRQHLRYRLLSDRQLKVSAAYRVAYQIPAADEKDYRANGIDLPKIPGATDYWLTIPTAFIVGRDGTIKFVFFNSDPSIAIAPAELIAAAKSALATAP